MKEWLRRRRHPPEKLGSGLCLGDKRQEGASAQSMLVGSFETQFKERLNCDLVEPTKVTIPRPWCWSTQAQTLL